MRYSLSALRVFKAVADLGSITEAAERLGRTPSTVSMALKTFEEELGVQLFQSERKNRLTPTGQFVRDRANDVLSQYERAISSIEAFARNQTGRVDLACVPSVAVSILPRVLLHFRAKYPQVEISVHDADSPSVVESVLAGKVGLGVASVRRDQPDLDFKPLFNDALGIVCRADDPLARHDGPVSWDVVRGRTLLGNGITGLIDSTQFSDLVSRAPIKVYNVLSLLALVRAEVGITVLPRLSLPSSEHDLRFVALDDPMARRTVGLLSRASEVASPAGEAFARELKSVVDAAGAELGLQI
ncbi:LysR family transcriptional regulator [Mesorhizobium sp. SP-1A]|uniref:LysR family transcriptional regulator n=1 Tax=Mesorhizobium sp. SP-1A TaxID=3077840 RepID=UPI0028F6E4E1|nr:LysR substrate-binding domain-containing protein [Mesorhizobium sp. SP-1A]